MISTADGSSQLFRAKQAEMQTRFASKLSELEFRLRSVLNAKSTSQLNELRRLKEMNSRQNTDPKTSSEESNAIVLAMKNEFKSLKDLLQNKDYSAKPGNSLTQDELMAFLNQLQQQIQHLQISQSSGAPSTQNLNLQTQPQPFSESPDVSRSQKPQKVKVKQHPVHFPESYTPTRSDNDGNSPSKLKRIRHMPSGNKTSESDETVYTRSELRRLLQYLEAESKTKSQQRPNSRHNPKSRPSHKTNLGKNKQTHHLKDTVIKNDDNYDSESESDAASVSTISTSYSSGDYPLGRANKSPLKTPKDLFDNSRFESRHVQVEKPSSSNYKDHTPYPINSHNQYYMPKPEFLPTETIQYQPESYSADPLNRYLNSEVPRTRLSTRSHSQCSTYENSPAKSAKDVKPTVNGAEGFPNIPVNNLQTPSAQKLASFTQPKIQYVNAITQTSFKSATIKDPSSLNSIPSLPRPTISHNNHSTPATKIAAFRQQLQPKFRSSPPSTIKYAPPKKHKYKEDVFISTIQDEEDKSSLNISNTFNKEKTSNNTVVDSSVIDDTVDHNDRMDKNSMEKSESEHITPEEKGEDIKISIHNSSGEDFHQTNDQSTQDNSEKRVDYSINSRNEEMVSNKDDHHSRKSSSVLTEDSVTSVSSVEYKDRSSKDMGLLQKLHEFHNQIKHLSPQTVEYYKEVFSQGSQLVPLSHQMKLDLAQIVTQLDAPQSMQTQLDKQTISYLSALCQ